MNTKGSGTGKHREHVNAQRGTPVQTTNATEEKNPRLYNNPIIDHGILVHDYAFMGALSNSSEFTIKNPTPNGLIVPAMGSGTSKHREHVNAQRGTPVQTTNAAEEKYPSFHNSPTIIDQGRLLHNYAFMGAASRNSKFSINNPVDISSEKGVPVADIPKVSASHPSATPTKWPANTGRKISDDVNTNHASFYR